MVCASLRLAWLACSLQLGGASASPKFKGAHAALALVQNPTQAEHKNPDAMEVNVVSSAIGMFALHAPNGGVAAAAKNGAPTADGGEKKQPVGIQVEEKIMENMQNALSNDCRKRYSAMIA